MSKRSRWDILGRLGLGNKSFWRKGKGLDYLLGRSLRMEQLEERQLLSVTNLEINGFRADGNDLVVEYTITGDEDATPFDIGVYRSADGDTVNPDVILMPATVNDQAKLTASAEGTSHSVTLSADFSDLDEDYYLMAVLDINQVFDEPSGDNLLKFEGGIFQDADGIIHVHGTDSSDTVSIAESTDGTEYSLDLNVMPGEHTLSISGTSSVERTIHIRSHGGDDGITMVAAGPGVETLVFAGGWWRHGC